MSESSTESSVTLKKAGLESNAMRIDPPHSAERAPLEPVRGRKLKLQPRRAAAIVEAANHVDRNADVAEAVPIHEATAELPPRVHRHMEDIAWRLSERLREVEQRELEFTGYTTRFQIAESNAQTWVMEQEQQLTERERSLQLEADELQTRVAANAAVEIAAQTEQQQLRETWEQQLRTIEQREAELVRGEERLHEEQHALRTATERFQAEQRRANEQLRGQRQQWERLCAQDKEQAERTLLNLQKHRDALEQREQKLRSREAILEHLQDQHVHWERLRLEMEQERTEVVRERRIATEQRWIAGNLWAKLTSSNYVMEGELYAALRQVSRELETLYRRERESLEKLRAALIDMAKKMHPGAAISAGASSTREARTAAMKSETPRYINRAGMLAEAS
jgi:hypothetical protein